MQCTIQHSTVFSPLQFRSIGYDVILVQRLLNQASYGYLAENGIFDLNTERVLKQFQQQHNLVADGFVNFKTWKALLPHKIARGSRGYDVEQLQVILNEMGYASLMIDGIFGAKTEQSVKQFQQQNDCLNAHGIVGPLTWYILLSEQLKKQ